MQGAGDDQEHWARGLTPELMWANVHKVIVPSNEAGAKSNFNVLFYALPVALF